LKREPSAAALTCGAGFFIWAQPAIPDSAVATASTLDKNFFILSISENA
jgi:hypothetical protein